jgi:hypothetical protein
MKIDFSKYPFGYSKYQVARISEGGNRTSKRYACRLGSIFYAMMKICYVHSDCCLQTRRT